MFGVGSSTDGNLTRSRPRNEGLHENFGSIVDQLRYVRAGVAVGGVGLMGLMKAPHAD